MQSEGERILTVPEEMGYFESPMVTGNEWVSLPDISQAGACGVGGPGETVGTGRT